MWSTAGLIKEVQLLLTLQKFAADRDLAPEPEKVMSTKKI
jgi:hypothetical protein